MPVIEFEVGAPVLVTRPHKRTGRVVEAVLTWKSRTGEFGMVKFPARPGLAGYDSLVVGADMLKARP